MRLMANNRHVYVYTCIQQDMAKLYWRYKKNGKWTWRPATGLSELLLQTEYAELISQYQEEEE